MVGDDVEPKHVVLVDDPLDPVEADAHPQRVELIRDGQVMHDNLQHELMTESQLRCQLRHKGVAKPDDVAEAWIESSGEISVIRKPDRQLMDQLSAIRAALERRDGPAKVTARLNPS